MKLLLKKLPIPVSGLMLGLAAAGNLVLSYGNIFRTFLGFISALILVLLVLKLFTDLQSFLEALNNPVVCSVMATFPMGVMLLSTYIKPYTPRLAFTVWIIGLSLHCLIMIYFTWKYILRFDIKKIFPSYFIVYVGIVAASVTAPAYNLAALGRYIFWFGFATYLVLLPVVLYRVLIVRGIPEPALPTVIIFAAPSSLCLAGYMNSFQVKNMTIVIFLVCISLIMTLSALIYLPRMLKLKFYPSYSSFTFPFVISGIAMKLTNAFLIKNGKESLSLKYIVYFEEAIAVIIVLYVLIRYIKFLFIKDKNTIIKETVKI